MSEEKKFEKQDRRGIVDRALEKVTSRKLLVWGTATGLLFAGNLDANNWLYVSMAYIGSQALADIVATVKGK